VFLGGILGSTPIVCELSASTPQAVADIPLHCKPRDRASHPLANLGMVDPNDRQT